MLFLWTWAGPISAGAAGGSEHHKIEARDAATALQLKAAGGTLIADYGGYQLYDVPQWSAGSPPASSAEVHDDYNQVFLNTRVLDTRREAVQTPRQSAGWFAGRRAHLVQFSGPIQPAWRQALTNTGARIVSYIPQNAYLLYGDAASLARVQALGSNSAILQWEAPYEATDKIHPSARTVDAAGQARVIGTDWFAVQLVADDAPNRATLALLDQLKLEPLRRQDRVLDYVNVVVRLTPSSLSRVAAQPDVVSIQPDFERHLFCERQAQIVAGNLAGNIPSGPGYLSWLASKGFTQAQFTASGFSVDVADSGLDNGTVLPNHFGLYTGGSTNAASRVVYNRLVGTANPGTTLKGCDGHGTLNSHIIAGYDDLAGFPFADSSGYHYGLGICPFVTVGSSVIFDPNNYTSPSFTNLQAGAYQGGARISNNSWGANTAGTYTVDDQAYDALARDAEPGVPGNQEMVIVVAAGNAGSAAGTVGSPAGGKNVITVGASEGVQAFGGSDGSNISDAQANSANDMVSFSSRGPTSDGRHKPDLVAPGTHISGGVAQAADPAATGTADACFTGSGISGGVGSSFFPAGQQFYSASSGTSHSTPCVSGGCALLRQYFINQGANPPSPAMTKAYLMNCARYLTGAMANDRLWSDAQGMGELNLGTAFDGAPRILRDQLPADLFTASGQLRAFGGEVSDTNQPLRVTLAWTDAPGSTAGRAYNNNLDLVVTIGGVTYKGNVFNGAYSTNGGSADSANNVESVFLPAGTAGPFLIQVLGTSINSIGVPNSSNALCQDFALVVYNATNATVPVLVPAGATVSGESYFPTNGVLDPGEIATLNLALQNTGLADTANLSATLVSASNLVSLSGAQSYGVIGAGGPAVSRPFAVSASGSCGDTVTAVLQLADGLTNLGTASYTLRLGRFITTTNFRENFDAVTAPALPSGWSNALSGLGSNWITSTGAYDTAPNSAYGPESDGRGITELLSPGFTLANASSQLVFRHRYALEASPGPVAYDGGVLEIQIGAGSFSDILAAGGSFASGGYTQTIFNGAGADNPLGGRSAWTGSSGGFVTATVNLPASAAGQTVRLKWRLATDSGNFYGGSGWYLDSVAVVNSSNQCATALITPAALTSAAYPGSMAFSFRTVLGQPYTVEYKDALSDPAWTTLQTLTGDGSVHAVTNASGAPQRFFRVRTP